MLKIISKIVVILFVVLSTSVCHANIKNDTGTIAEAKQNDILDRELTFDSKTDLNPDSYTEIEKTYPATIEDDSERFFSELSDSITKDVLRECTKRKKILAFLQRKKVRSPEMYTHIIFEEVKDWHDQKVFASLLVPESGGDPNAVSCKGAKGPWQIMPFWQSILKIKGSLFDPRTNLRYAKRILNIHTQEAKGRMFKKKGGLWRYSGGSDWYPDKIQKLVNEIETAGCQCLSYPLHICPARNGRVFFLCKKIEIHEKSL
ncbi:MAG: lytic transglycosylase domain-containing protein [Candidatus Gracilibacteria bacterium]|nr:lytic transglycosylase domain-containing protein [Candidatus Gracilibacteria bacterium]